MQDVLWVMHKMPLNLTRHFFFSFVAFQETDSYVEGKFKGQLLKKHTHGKLVTQSRNQHRNRTKSSEDENSRWVMQRVARFLAHRRLWNINSTFKWKWPKEKVRISNCWHVLGALLKVCEKGKHSLNSFV